MEHNEKLKNSGFQFLIRKFFLAINLISYTKLFRFVFKSNNLVNYFLKANHLRFNHIKVGSLQLG